MAVLNGPVLGVGKSVMAALTEEEQAALRTCAKQLSDKQERAILRENFYDAKYRLEKIGISIPPHMEEMGHVLGWPAQTVDKLAERLTHQGFVLPGEPDADSGLKEIFSENQMEIELPQAFVSTLIHGAGFIAVTPGDPSRGEPDALIMPFTARQATGIWNPRSRTLSAALIVADSNLGTPTSMYLHTGSHVLSFTRDNLGAGQNNWRVERFVNPSGVVMVTPLRYRSRLGRPFGTSRITRPVMSMTMEATRTVLRTESHAEFFSSPQRYLLGADESMFEDANGNRRSGWDVILGHVWAVPTEGQDDKVQIGQFAQSSMEPHIAMQRQITMRFSGETNIPASILGVLHDNPASAEAIDAEWAGLVGVAELAQRDLGVSLNRVAIHAVMIKEGLAEPPESLRLLKPKWRDPSTPTQMAMTASVVQQVTSGILPPTSIVALEGLGYDETDISRIQTEQRAERVRTLMDGLGAVSQAAQAKSPKLTELAKMR